MRLVLVAALLAGLAFAGCAANSASSTTTSALDLGSVPVEAGATTGSIRGVVVDEAIRPVPKAAIAFGDRNATADANGRFSFVGLAPGTVFLTATAKGFLPVQTSAQVEAGKVTDLRIALAADLSPQEYHQTMQLKGFIQVAGTIATYAVDLLANETGVSTCPQCTLYFQNDRSLTTIVYEAVWTDSVPNPQGPESFYYEVEGVNAENIQSAFEPSPILHHLSAQELWANVTHMQARLTGPAAWVEYNQEYDLFLTLFHVGPAPEKWSFVNGDT